MVFEVGLIFEGLASSGECTTSLDQEFVEDFGWF